MIARIIDWSARNIMLVLIATFFAVGGGIYALRICRSTPSPTSRTRRSSSTPNIRARRRRWSRIRSPIRSTTAMLTVPKSKVVRGFSFFGVSFVYIIFEDGTDIYWARSRVLEYLNAPRRGCRRA